MSWSTVSNATIRSRRPKRVTFRSSTASNMSDITFISAVSVEWCWRYTDCRCGMRWQFSRCLRIWSATIRSVTLEMKIRLEMGGNLSIHPDQHHISSKWLPHLPSCLLALQMIWSMWGVKVNFWSIQFSEIFLFVSATRNRIRYCWTSLV